MLHSNKQYINPRATAVHGMTQRNGQLMKNGEILDAVSQQDGLTSFRDWFHNLPGEDKVLVAHNNKKFDSKILFRNLPGETFSHSDSMDIMKKVQKKGMNILNAQIIHVNCRYYSVCRYLLPCSCTDHT